MEFSQTWLEHLLVRHRVLMFPSGFKPHGILFFSFSGIDCARGSLKDAALRIREKKRLRRKKVTLICADLGADVPGRKQSPSDSHMQELLTWSLQDEANMETRPPEFKMVPGGGISDETFDVVSIQFAIHYMMSDRKRARRFFHTVSELLDIGGNLICTTIDARVLVGHLMSMGLDYHFDRDDDRKKNTVVEVGGGACRITFEFDTVKRIIMQSDTEDLFGLQYKFALFEGSLHEGRDGYAVNLPEWLTPLPALKTLAKEAGLELEYVENFHEFYDNRKEEQSARKALHNMHVLNSSGSITKEEWDICRLYAAMKFRKVRESRINLDDQQEFKESVKTSLETDNSKAKKMLPMAMGKAKKVVGEEKWKALSSAEKKRLTEIELEKLSRYHANRWKTLQVNFKCVETTLLLGKVCVTV
mmetsp:Transcript_27343/g.66373  ORF Transcript_27343/g.66373 Transcript_27343/m.66373 type:complete len:417 (+) Transcript_27343:287-1537(+)